MNDLETRLHTAADRWRRQQPPGPRPDPSAFVTVRPLRRRRDLLVPLAAAAAVVAVTAGILTSRHYTNSSPPATTPTITVLHDGDTVAATGRVVISAGGNAQFCPEGSPSPAHTPAQYQASCGKYAVSVAPIDADRLTYRKTYQGIVSGDAYLQGVWRDGTIAVQKQEAPHTLVSQQASDGPPTPCPAPDKGWVHGFDPAPGPLRNFIENHPDEFSGIWGTSPLWKNGHPLMGANLGWEAGVNTIGVIGDKKAALNQLRGLYSSDTNVCLVQTHHTATELKAAQQELNTAMPDIKEVWSVNGPHLERNAQGEYVAVCSIIVTTYSKQVQELVDRVGPDLVHVYPWLEKVG